MAGENSYGNSRGTQKISVTRGWDVEKWVGLLVLAALALLIAIRMGFRGVNVLGVRAGVS
jgi:hypothetical protein